MEECEAAIQRGGNVETMEFKIMKSIYSVKRQMGSMRNAKMAE
jgi:hypothetical protein